MKRPISFACFIRSLNSLVALSLFFYASADCSAQIVIGGPDGVVIGRGYGVRIGGNNGVRIGGGRGARFGPPGYGVQLGGGYGAQFGPYPNGVHLGGNPTPPDSVVPFTDNQTYRNPQRTGSIPTNSSAGGSALPGRSRPSDTISARRDSFDPNALNGRKILYLPPESRRAVTYSLNGTRFRLRPGNQVDLSRNQSWTVEFSAGSGRPPRSVVVDEPGMYVFRDTGSGLDLVRVDQPNSAPSDQTPLPPPPPADEMEEILPAPQSSADDPILEDRSETENLRRGNRQLNGTGAEKPMQSVLEPSDPDGKKSAGKLKSVLEKSR